MAILIIITIVLFCVSSYNLIGSITGTIDNENFKSKAVSVNATVTYCKTEIKTTTDSKHHTHKSEVYYIDVKYKYNGRNYKCSGIYSSKKYSSGGSVTVLVNPDNPSDARKEIPSPYWSIIPIVIFGAFFGVSVFLAIKIIRYYISGGKPDNIQGQIQS